MSRIFDALRRSEEERATQASPTPAQNNRLRDLIKGLEARAGEFDRVGRIVCRTSADEAIVSSHKNHGVGAEKFRVLCHRLRQIRHHRAFSRLLVTSAIPKEGKTFVALNLALTLATSSARVALIDTDMRQSGLNRTLGLPPLPGLADYLEGRVDLLESFRVVEPFKLYYVAAGTPTTNPANLLQGARMKEFLAQTASAFDWVVLDSPPLNPVADAHCLAGLTDGVLLVVRAGVTPQSGLQQSLTALEGAFVAGLVFNGMGDPHRDAYYYYYTPPSAENFTHPSLSEPLVSRNVER